MLIVGLTGGIGTGKSTVAHLFAKYGVPIIDADVIAHNITAHNEPALKKIIAHFGRHLLLPDGNLNRTKLRDIIFSDKQKRIWLEHLLHPIIREHIEQQISHIATPYCIVVVPLLLEVASYPFINRILVIDATEQTQCNRVSIRDQTDPSRVAAILKAQITREQRLQKADDIILNDGSLANLIPQVEKLHTFYENLGCP